MRNLRPRRDARGDRASLAGRAPRLRRHARRALERRGCDDDDRDAHQRMGALYPRGSRRLARRIRNCRRGDRGSSRGYGRSRFYPGRAKRSTGWRDRFAVVVSADEVARGKPAPDVTASLRRTHKRSLFGHAHDYEPRYARRVIRSSGSRTLTLQTSKETISFCSR